MKKKIWRIAMKRFLMITTTMWILVEWFGEGVTRSTLVSTAECRVRVRWRAAGRVGTGHRVWAQTRATRPARRSMNHVRHRDAPSPQWPHRRCRPPRSQISRWVRHLRSRRTSLVYSQQRRALAPSRVVRWTRWTKRWSRGPPACANSSALEAGSTAATPVSISRADDVGSDEATVSPVSPPPLDFEDELRPESGTEPAEARTISETKKAQ